MHRSLRTRRPFLMFVDEPPAEGGGAPAAPVADGGKTFTQDEVNALLAKELRPLKEQIKTLKPAAEKLTEIEAANQTELEKAVKRAEEAEQKAAQYEQREAHRALVKTVATEKKLDGKARDLLAKSGITDESALRDYADTLAEVIATKPAIPTPLYVAANGDTSAKEATARAQATALLKKGRT